MEITDFHSHHAGLNSLKTDGQRMRTNSSSDRVDWRSPLTRRLGNADVVGKWTALGFGYPAIKLKRLPMSFNLKLEVVRLENREKSEYRDPAVVADKNRECNEAVDGGSDHDALLRRQRIFTCAGTHWQILRERFYTSLLDGAVSFTQ